MMMLFRRLSTGLGGWLPRGRHLVIGMPYLWMLMFFAIPFAIIFKISLAETEVAIPPYTALASYVEEKLEIVLNLGNYGYLLEDPLYLESYLQSLQVATISTLLCLLVGYPMAWSIVHSSPAMRNALLMLVVLPSWTSFLIRVYAWIGILKNNGFINNFLISLGIIDAPVQLLNTDLAVYIGIVYAYLPFMILPIYTALMRVDYSLMEAAADLGAKPWKSFLTVLLPLTKGGIIAGSMLVFVPAVGEFVIPELLVITSYSIHYTKLYE